MRYYPINLFLILFCLINFAAFAEKIKIAYIPANQTSTWHQATRKAGEFFAATQNVELLVLDPNDDTHEQLRMAREIAPQVQAAIFVPTSSGSFQVAKAFKDINPKMPVIVIDRDVPSNLVDLFIAFGSRESGQTVAKKAIELLLSKKGKAEGKVFVVTGDLTSVAGIDRRDGMLDILKEHPGLEIVVTLEAKKWLSADVQPKIEASLNAFGKPDMIVSGFEGGTQAAVNALRRKDWDKPASAPDHVVIGSIDTGSAVLDAIKTGSVDFTVDQPNLFYLPAAIYYTLGYLKDGPAALPEVGKKLEGKDIPIYDLAKESDKKMLWQFPFWAPATVEMSEATKHKQIKMLGLMVDKSNADAPYLYANVAGIGK